MNTIYILIILNNLYGHTYALSTEFNSLESCQKQAERIIERMGKPDYITCTLK